VPFLRSPNAQASNSAVPNYTAFPEAVFNLAHNPLRCGAVRWVVGKELNAPLSETLAFTHDLGTRRQKPARYQPPRSRVLTMSGAKQER